MTFISFPMPGDMWFYKWIIVPNTT